jgi:ring-1,2-phenylacetyl-CoA epoxidase subunit PaaE
MMVSPRFHTLGIADIRQETAEAISVAFAVPAALAAAYRYLAGQYVTLRATIEGDDVRRTYSICTAPDDGELRVCIKLLSDGVFSGWARERLRVGDTLAVMTPDGRFVLPPPADRPTARRPRTIVAFAAGSGITPVMAILRAVLANEPASRFFLFYGKRSRAEIIFRPALEDLKDRYLTRLSVFHVLSREQQDVAALNGHLDAAKARLLLRHIVPVETVDHVLVCGPQPMIEDLAGALPALGLTPDRVHVERFTPGSGGRRRAAPVAPETPPRAVAPVAVARVISEGVTSEIPIAADETIIDAAILAGRNLPYSYRGGMCCTYRARLVEGKVAMDVNYSLEPWELEAGFVLTCQSRPLTTRVVIDYDQM